MNTCPRCRRTYADGVRFCPTDGSLIAAVVDPYLGKVLMGQFQLVSLAGRGAMGTVYRADQARMDRAVAVKVLRGDLLKDETAVKRFLREAQAAARLSHPNIVTVHLVGESDEGVPFIVMEYVEGITLGAFVERERVVETRRALRIVRQIASALGEAHAQGIVHRDLKADNILLTEKRTENDVVKVLDFGIAKLLSGDGGEIAQLTRDGTIFGTPHYIAPEQAAGHDVDGRADLYSLGVILFRMLVGRLPFDGNSGMQVLMRHVREVPPRPRALRPEVPPALDELIMKALEKDRAHRFADAESFVAALAAAERTLDVDASQTLMGIPLPPRGDARSTRVTSRPERVVQASPRPDTARLEPQPIADDPTRTRAGEQGLEAWADDAEAAVKREDDRNPEFGTITADAGVSDDERSRTSRRFLRGGTVAAALLVGAVGLYAGARAIRQVQPPVVEAKKTVPVESQPPQPGHKLVEEHVAASGGYAIRLGFEKKATAGELNVMHVFLDGEKGIKVAGARLELMVRGAGEHEERTALHDSAEGYVAELAFRNPGRHHVRLSTEPLAGRRFTTTFDLDVAPEQRAAQGAPVHAGVGPSSDLPAAGRAPTHTHRDHGASAAPGAATDDPNDLPVTLIPAASGDGNPAAVVPHALGPVPAPGTPVTAPGGVRRPPAVPSLGAPFNVVPQGRNETPVSDDPYRVLDRR